LHAASGCDRVLTGAPTFPGYTWPIHTEACYSLRWSVQEVYPQIGMSTTSWNPQVMIRTETVQSDGIVVVMDIPAAEYVTAGEGQVTDLPAMRLGPMSVHAVLTPQGYWKDVHWSVPTNPTLPPSVLTAMLPLSDLLPLVPVNGWTADRPMDVYIPASTLEIGGLHIQLRTPQHFAVHIAPSVRDGHWTVRSTLTLPSKLPIFVKGPSTPGQPRGLYPGTITAHRVTQDDLKGRDGGRLIRAEGTWQGTISTANSRQSNFTARWELTQIGS